MKKLQVALLIIAFMGIALALAVGLGWRELTTPINIAQPDKIISVPSGKLPDEIVQILENEGVVTHGWFLKQYIRLQNSGRFLKAGEYTFTSPTSPLEVLQKLEIGEAGANKITIVEGWNRWDIARAMSGIKTFKVSSPKPILQSLDDPRLIKDLDPEAMSLEGYIFPETYFILSNSRPTEIIEHAVVLFKKIWQRDLAAAAKSLNMTVHQVVTIASIIETEAKLKEERPIIASVIYNRLKKNMPLGMDSTIVYASKLAGKWHEDGKVYQSDIDRVSPYNTRKIIGLPIGPVACPGLASLKAALEPAQTDYIYYVRNPARNNGAHNFYNDETKFAEGVQALRDWEKSRDQPKKPSVTVTRTVTNTVNNTGIKAATGTATTKSVTKLVTTKSVTKSVTKIAKPVSPAHKVGKKNTRRKKGHR